MLGELVKEELIAIQKIPVGRKAYQVISLTGAGRDFVAVGAHKRRRKAGKREGRDAQRYWHGLADVRQLEHDNYVFEAVMQDTEDVRGHGGRIRRVRLEAELRGVLASAGETARQYGGGDAAERARREAAEQVGLRVCAEGVPLPDALVEIEEADGRCSVRAIEVVTGAYSHTQVKKKREAGFRLYTLPTFRSERRRRRGSVGKEEPFPLSWGRGGH